jgi:UDP-N-acetylmuramoyl-L-alanyl-D-glutamate--2,6-diaminopimelate ligase
VAQLAPVPGRMEHIGGGAKPLVVVDYAHTPDALEHALTTLREVLQTGSRSTPRASRLTCVFGCGGERDPGKRPQMGRIAARLADRVIVTSDNPRNEDPRRIIDDILAGIRGIREELAVIADRRSAVRYAVAGACPGDVVLLAGKGHENYQILSGVKHPFSDAAEARRALRGSR